MGLTDGQRRFVMRDDSRRRLLALDTLCFIYRFEANPEYLAATRDLFGLFEQGECRGLASVLALTECLVAPLRQGRTELASTYRHILTRFPNLELAPLDSKTADLAASLRAAHGLSTPDALHLATAIEGGADAFVTHDRSLARQGEIEVLPLVA